MCPQPKKILIISDNPSIVEAVAMINQDQVNAIEALFQYAISPFSKKGDFNAVLLGEVQTLDLRIDSVIHGILDHFDIIISVHCKQIFPPSLVNRVKCINIHPGYNPINRGWYPQVFAIIHDLEIGATIHEIDEKLDHGAIIDRVKVEKYSHDTSFSLYSRVVASEIELWRKNVRRIISGDYLAFQPEEEGVLYLKKDFKALLKLDLAEKMTLGHAINRLRALTFDGYRNAYFVNEDGSKTFVEIKLTREEA